MSSPSTAAKVNYLVMKYLHFRNARGDLQEGHVYAKRLRDYASRCHLSLCSSTKTPILCSEGSKTGVPKGKSAQKPRFCARNARKCGFRRQKAHKNADFVLGRKFLYGFETCADCFFKASCEKLAPFMENEVARKNMNL